MRAAVFRAPGSIEVEDVATPAPAAGAARVRVAFHLADQTGGAVKLPIADVNYAMVDPWGRYS